MERTTTVDQAKDIFGSNLVGPEELNKIANQLGIKLFSTNKLHPIIPFSPDFLYRLSSEYLCFYGSTTMENGDQVTINNLRSRFGIDPDLAEPCFYNQDWYLFESFAQEQRIENKWYLIKKDVLNDYRGKDPDIIINENKSISLPTACICSYVFFAWFLHTSGEILWSHDFIWCNDTDAYGDRVYVGRYHDINKINRHGFNIHRHLKIKQNYSITYYLP